MKKWQFFAIFILFGFFSTAGCKNLDKSPAGDQILPHPRILLLKGETNQITAAINANPTWNRLHLAILAESDKIIGQAPLERIQIGRRLLGTSREALRRIFYLSYAYRMTDNTKYAQRAEKELLAVSNFSDWNPSHFLDVAEMTMGVAIGYDWLFDKLPDESRKTIRDAIIEKGLKPSLDSKYNGWLKSTNNWNQVCNAGMTYGALAVMEDNPDLAKQIIDRSVSSIPVSMNTYKPDGGYAEGYSYWDYGTSFNVMFLSAVEKAFSTDFGLCNTPGYLQTGRFLQFMTGPSGLCFNFSDSGSGASLSPAMFWFAQRNNDPSLLWVEKSYLLKSDYSSFVKNRLLPAIMIWAKEIPMDKITEPASKFWVSQGASPVCMMHTSWTDPDGIYVGFKAGSPTVSHAHMDIGSFVMEAEGIRWSSDFGMQNYESLESKGVDLWNMKQNSQRWTVIRLNNLYHSTISVDNQLQSVTGFAKIDKSSAAPAFSFAVSDISTLYENQLASLQRGIGIVDQKYVVVRDEFKTGTKTSTVRWAMLTSAAVALGTKDAVLTKDGKKLYLKVEGPSSLQMKTWSTAPVNAYDSENPGTTLVGFECNLPANTTEFFQVSLIPGKYTTSIPQSKPLKDW